ncbi:glycerophosphodiester phosphodiesterase [Umboniibacter marinipuniceus]|uniref:Glycerophosphoryl diester phosphodiesterase n=1 Tax=Umboniibacter marinipuniceus TaxID=569599 RepID=A0A3M0A8U6_9GAMM|nr:glycerophosphodiester phosphodiesterase [Umboniibacter marinipuniceus]RMA79929.1 glycerophosphoryl diester phosphodiesterase [Umboniibacter marinipuniceus]
MKRLIVSLLVLGIIYTVLRLWPSSVPTEPPSFFSSNSFDVIAHRGGKDHRPENTLVAFRHAAAIGATVLELDVHLSADDKLVVIHDDRVDRTTDGNGLVAELTLSELKALDAGYGMAVGASYPYRGLGIGVPSLRSVTDEFSELRFVMEIKPNSEHAAVRLCEFIIANEISERVIVGSFHTVAMKAFRAMCPNVVTSSPTLEVARFFVLHKLGLTHWYSGEGMTLQIPLAHFGLTVVTPELIADAQENGLKVHVWTINDGETMRELIAWGVDGIITDVPELLQNIATTDDK